MSHKEIAQSILRFGFVFVFIWFGVTQLVSPASWANLVPTWIPSMLSVSTQTIVYANGVFEIVCALALVFEFFTPIVGFLLGLHLFGIVMSVGLGAIGVRDIGLALSLLALGFLSWNKQEVTHGN